MVYRGGDAISMFTGYTDLAKLQEAFAANDLLLRRR